jgi:hypothetical protein
MKAILSAICFNLIFFAVTAQKSPIKFGDIPMADMTMTSYAEDSSAAAVVLVDYGEAYIQVSSLSANMTFERHVRIKVLRKEGMQWANVIIPLYKSGSAEEKVYQLKASTFNYEKGNIIESKLNKDGIFREGFNRNIVHEKFTLPDVKEGSIVEFTYKVSSDFLTNFPNWEFQKSIPTRLSEYWAILPDFFIFQKYMQGYVPVTSYDIKNLNQSGYAAKGHHWVSKNVPAFKAEPHMTSETDYISKINFALSHINFPGQMTREIMGSWPKLVTLLMADEDFYGVIKGSGFLKNMVEEVTLGLTEPVEKITAIHNYVKQNIEWDGYKDFYAANLKKVMERKKGSSGDINLMLASMLEKAGFDVEMILLSTRDHGFIREEFPMARQFNYTVCLVRLADKNIFLDATEKYLPINVLPERCLNGRGLIISNKNSGWTPLDTKTKSKTVVSADFELEETGSLKGKISFTHDGYDANRMRKAFEAKGKETYIKDFVGSKLWKLDSIDFQSVSEVSKPAKEVYELEISDHASLAGENIYVNPFITSQIEMNPYKSETRNYPVDYGSLVEQIYLCKIKVPDGFALEEAPESKILVLPGNAAKYVYNVSTASGGEWITVTSSFQINRNIFLQQEYPNLREFYNQVVAKQAEQIVFKKKL